MVTTVFRVEGMTCDHCAKSVTAEVGEIPGVSQVLASVADGTVAVTAAAPPTEADVRSAVEEAGYSLVGVQE